MHFNRKIKLCSIEAAAIVLAVCALLFPSMQLFEHTGDNYFAVRLKWNRSGKSAVRGPFGGAFGESKTTGGERAWEQ